MTTSDWIVDIALILIVVRQLREQPITRRFWVLPVAIVAFVAHSYLVAIPTAGKDLVLIGALTAVGAALGIAGGLTTKVRGSDGVAYVRAGATAASLWIGSMSARMAFLVWINYDGRAWLEHFSMRHDITSGSAWQDAFVLMALSEVVLRIGIILIRGQRAAQNSRVDRPAEVVTV